MTHLGRALAILDEALTWPADDAPAAAHLARMLGAMKAARNHLMRVDAADVGQHLIAEECHYQIRHWRCGQPADVVDDNGFGLCARHANKRREEVAS